MYPRQQKTAGRSRRCENRGILAPQVGFLGLRWYGGVISAGRDSYIGVRVLVYMNVMRVNKAMRWRTNVYDIP